MKKNFEYLDYLLRRFSAYPNIWWSLANEYDLLISDISINDFYDIEEFVHNNDPYHHLLSNHQCFIPYDWSRKNITHICSQTKNLAPISRLINEYKKPAIVDECCYEGNIEHYWGSISGKEMVYRFYRMIASGAYCTHGETFYSDDDVLWWAKGGELKGESPARIKYLKNIVESFSTPLVAVPNFMEGLLNQSEESLTASLPYVPDQFKELTKALAKITGIMSKEQKNMHLDFEREWVAKAIDDSVVFVFLDLRTCAKMPLNLPEGNHYKIELIDAWKMRRKVLIKDATGRVMLDLPGKEGNAILATKID